MKKRFLIDTHAFVEIRMGSLKLSSRAKKLFLDPNSQFFLSLASVWEMQIKIALGKLEIDLPLKEAIESALSADLIQLLPIQLEHLYDLASLPFHHRDPFDRLLASQARIEKMALLSSDKAFDPYELERIW